MNQYDVFLSYRRRDGAALAERVYEYLTEKGLHVFFDKENI